MKKLLIIQQDEAYFLFETLLVLERFRDAIKEFSISIIVNQKSLDQIQDGSCPLPNRVITDIQQIQNEHFDICANLSLNETSWTLLNEIKAENKIGTYRRDGQLQVTDAWSAFLLTHKAGSPFLTFHLQEIYKNILGIKQMTQINREKKSYNKIVFSLCNTHFFPATEQEKLIKLVHLHHPQVKICDVTEIDPVSDLSHILYIGPASLEALKICEGGATGLFLSNQFQGFNLLPFRDGHFFISSLNKSLMASDLIRFIDNYIYKNDRKEDFPFAIYQINEENLFGSYLQSLNASDDHYPIYQSHVVLWNFILNLFDINLEITRCSPGQMVLLLDQQEVLQKLIRLYDYAMSSIDTIYQEARSTTADSAKLSGHMKNLEDIEKITDQISQSHVFLRPVLDFYRIRRGQNNGSTLLEQSQHSFLTYSEEHQALRALMELFTVTLNKNEASI